MPRPRTTSTSSITGTGLKKCTPTVRSGTPSLVPSSVIESDDVLLATTAYFSATGSTAESRSTLTAMFSNTASTTTSAPSHAIFAVGATERFERVAWR